jgi:hypothetical protein
MHILILAGSPAGTPLVLLLMGFAVSLAGMCWSFLLRKGGLMAAFLSHCMTNVLLLGWGLRWLGYV